MGMSENEKMYAKILRGKKTVFQISGARVKNPDLGDTESGRHGAQGNSQHENDTMHSGTHSVRIYKASPGTVNRGKLGGGYGNDSFP